MTRRELALAPEFRLELGETVGLTFSIFKSAGGGVETPESELSPESEPLSRFSGVTVPSDGGFDPSQKPLSPFESPPESVESFSTLSSFLRSSERSNFDKSDFLRSRRFLRAFIRVQNLIFLLKNTC